MDTIPQPGTPEFAAWLAAERAKSWAEGKQAMEKFVINRDKRRLPYPTNPYKEA